MSGEMEILFSVSGRIHVLLRREVNRIIDVEWMCVNEAYAREVAKLARTTDSDELRKLADRFEEVYSQRTGIKRIIDVMPQRPEVKYVSTLR